MKRLMNRTHLRSNWMRSLGRYYTLLLRLPFRPLRLRRQLTCIASTITQQDLAWAAVCEGPILSPITESSSHINKFQDRLRRILLPIKLWGRYRDGYSLLIVAGCSFLHHTAIPAPNMDILLYHLLHLSRHTPHKQLIPHHTPISLQTRTEWQPLKGSMITARTLRSTCPNTTPVLVPLNRKICTPSPDTNTTSPMLPSIRLEG